MYSKADLVDQLRTLGVQPGETLLVQSATREVGRVDGGVPGIVDALLAAVPEGTLVVYTATPENSDTSPLHHAAIAGFDQDKVRRFRAEMPAFDPDRTPASATLGRLPEEVRRRPGARRSGHPQTSFAALGERAEWLTEVHERDCHLGELSPTRRLYDARARALLIGVPVWCCTALHLAEYRIPRELQPQQRYGCVVRGADGRPAWEHFPAVRVTDVHFPAMAPALAEQVTGLRTGRFGDAECFLLPIAEAVDVSVKWLTDYRS